MRDRELRVREAGGAAQPAGGDAPRLAAGGPVLTTESLRLSTRVHMARGGAAVGIVPTADDALSRAYEHSLNEYRLAKADTRPYEFEQHRRYVDAQHTFSSGPQADERFLARLAEPGTPRRPVHANEQDHVGALLDDWSHAEAPRSPRVRELPHLRLTTANQRPHTPRTQHGVRMSPHAGNRSRESFDIISGAGARGASSAARQPSPPRAARRLANHSLYTHDIISQRPLLGRSPLSASVDPAVRDGVRGDPQLRETRLDTRHRPADHRMLALEDDPTVPPPRPEGVARRAPAPPAHGFDIIAHEASGAPDDAPAPRTSERAHVRPTAPSAGASPRPVRRAPVANARNEADAVGRLLGDEAWREDGSDADERVHRRRHVASYRADAGAWLIGNAGNAGASPRRPAYDEPRFDRKQRLAAAVGTPDGVGALMSPRGAGFNWPQPGDRPPPRPLHGARRTEDQVGALLAFGGADADTDARHVGVAQREHLRDDGRRTWRERLREEFEVARGAS